jgi:hypothetical protein
MPRTNEQTPNILTAPDSITKSAACYWNSVTKRMEPFIGLGYGRRVYISVPKCDLWVRPTVLTLGLVEFNKVLADLRYDTIDPVDWAKMEQADQKIDRLTVTFDNLFDKQMITGLGTLAESLSLRYPIPANVFQEMASTTFAEMIVEVEKLLRGILSIPYNEQIATQAFDPELPEIKHILDNYNPIRHRALVYLAWLLSE